MYVLRFLFLTVMYVSSVTGTYSPFAVDVMTGERRPGKQRITSFGELQAKFSKACIEDGLDRGENLFECTQGKSAALRALVL